MWPKWTIDSYCFLIFIFPNLGVRGNAWDTWDRRDRGVRVRLRRPQRQRNSLTRRTSPGDNGWASPANQKADHMLRAVHRRLVCAAVLFLVAAGAALAQAEKVYVTKTGAKYHRASCSSLRASKIEMPLAEAAARYGPCGNCKPPVPSAVPAPAPATMTATPLAPSAPAAARSTRCQATTKKGAQCSRNAKAGSSYCWQHGG